METFEFVTKKRRRNNKILMIGISLITVCGLALGARMLSGKIISDKAWDVVRTTELLDAVAYPNQSVYRWTANGGDFFHGGIKNYWARDIYNVPLRATEQEVNFSWLQTDWGDGLRGTNKTYYNGTFYDITNSQKRGQFYNPKAVATDGEVIATPTQELPYLADLSNNLVEVYVTFDKPYTLKEIREKIPGTLKTNWYWIGTSSTGDSSTWDDVDLFGTDEEGFTRQEFVDPKAVENAVKKVRKNGEKLAEEVTTTKTVDAFLTNLKAVLDAPGEGTYNDITPRDDIKAYLKKFGKLDLTKAADVEQLTFAGVVLTGRAEDFAALENADWIYATSIGAVVSKFPYYGATGQ